MLTKEDYVELEKRFVTAEEFGRAMSDVVGLIQTTSDSIIKEIKSLRVEFKEEMGELRTELKADIAELRTEFNEFRVEVRIASANHEKRIVKLEEKNYS